MYNKLIIDRTKVFRKATEKTIIKQNNTNNDIDLSKTKINAYKSS